MERCDELDDLALEHTLLWTVEFDCELRIENASCSQRRMAVVPEKKIQPP